MSSQLVSQGMLSSWRQLLLITPHPPKRYRSAAGQVTPTFLTAGCFTCQRKSVMKHDIAFREMLLTSSQIRGNACAYDIRTRKLQSFFQGLISRHLRDQPIPSRVYTTPSARVAGWLWQLSEASGVDGRLCNKVCRRLSCRCVVCRYYYHKLI